MKLKYRNTLQEIMRNKVFITSLILIVIAAYGFTITHFSMGIDDFGVNHYMNLKPESVGNMLQQGRLVHIFFHYVVGLADVIPFLNNFLGVLMLMMSSILYVGLINLISNHAFSTFKQIIFAGLFTTYSIISFKFIYDIDIVVTMLSYMCTPLAVVYAISWIESKKPTDFLKSMAFLAIAISSYESFNTLFICSVLFALILLAIFRKTDTKTLFKIGIKCALILLITFSSYYLVVKAAQYVTGNVSYVRNSIFSDGYSILSTCKTIAGRLLNRELFFAMEFSAFAVISVLLSIYYSVHEKRPFIFLLFAAMGVSTLLIAILQGYLYYRVSQTFNLFIAVNGLLAVHVLSSKRILKKTVCAAACLLLIWQIRDINLWFFRDWQNYQKNVSAMHRIATDLNEIEDVAHKPVCFTNRDYESFLMTWDENQTEIGESPIVSGIAFLGDIRSPDLIQLFRYQGYQFIQVPSVEQAQMALELSQDMPAYPADGYIQEVEDFVIVNMG